MNLTPYHAKYFAYELTKRSSSDSMQKLASTLVDAQVDLNPHQVEAALFAFRSPLSKGAILADEVGLGKTIEAGLVISQKWAEKKRKILIITPANLRKQWSQELIDKFFLPSTILEAKSFNEIIKTGNLNPFDSKEIVLCSYQFAKAKDVYIKLINWDLVVIDEAHRLRNVYKSGNKIAKAIKDALEQSPKILLTATPLQNSLLELYGLVSIIDDYAFGDLKSFKTQYSRVNGSSDESTFNELKERLQPICKRTLRRQVLEYIKYTNRIALVEEFYPTDAEQKLYDMVTDYLQRDSLFALPASQRKLMTLILRKLLASSTYAISGTLAALESKLQEIVRNQDKNTLFEPIVQDYEGTDELRDEWSEDESETEDFEEPTNYSDKDISDIKSEIESLKEFGTLAKSIKKNSKGEKLSTALERGFKELERLGADKKAIIFTESVRTQQYLKDILEDKGYKGKVVLFNGSNNDSMSRQLYNDWLKRHEGTDKITGSKTADMRAALVDFFRDEATIMVATEAAAEGINLQFCSLVINYDLPWNPQRIEQRIGRCHRYGQKFDVVVVNFLNKSNAADERVYQLLEEKFKIFNGVFGSSDEVLGSIESGVDFEKRIARIYQECRTKEQIQKAFDELQAELEASINDNLSSTKKSLLENFDEEVNEKLKLNLQESKSYLNRYENWLWEITKFYLGDDADFSMNEHSFTLKNNPFSELNINKGPYKIGKQTEDANHYRISHPLADKIINECKSFDLPVKEVTFDYTNTQTKVTTLEGLIGQSGWMKVDLLSVSTFEAEDYIMLSGVTETSEMLDYEQCKRFFSLKASEEISKIELDNNTKKILADTAKHQKETVLVEVEERNNVWFDQEYSKLDSWAEDLKVGLERELKDLDAEIRLKKAEAKKILKLDEKIKLQRVIKEMENQRSEKRKKLYEAQDEVDKRKEKLLNDIESKLKQNISQKPLFTIKWNLV